MLTKSLGSQGHQPLPRKGCSGSQSFTTYAPYTSLPWRRAWQPTPVFLSGESHGQRSLEGHGAEGREELDMSEYYILHLQGSQNLKVNMVILESNIQATDGLVEDSFVINPTISKFT